MANGKRWLGSLVVRAFDLQLEESIPGRGAVK